MTTYILLLRGINVGGKSTVSMAVLRDGLEKLGFKNVVTYINSGNVFVDSTLSAKTVRARVEELLIEEFGLDKIGNKVLVLTADELENIVAQAPKGFGVHPEKYHSDVIFLIEKAVSEAMEQAEINPKVDAVWEGKKVLYFQRISAKRTKSRMGKIIGKPIYKFLTIRSWTTTTKLLGLIKQREGLI